jgi:hypothetical protein
MGAKQTVIYNTMLVVGGCELALEKNPYSSTEMIIYDKETGKFKNSLFPQSCHIPVRSPMCYFDQSKQEIYVFGGCRGPKDHIDDVQVYNFSTA